MPPDDLFGAGAISVAGGPPGLRLASTGLRLIRGRGFTADDRPDAPRVAILGQSVARRFWRDADPIGSRIVYVPHEQSRWPLNHLVVRTLADPATLVPALRREAAAMRA